MPPNIYCISSSFDLTLIHVSVDLLTPPEGLVMESALVLVHN